MRVAPEHPVHLTYCTNVHAAESWTDTQQKLIDYLPAVKKQVCPDSRFGVGLRLSAIAATELKQEAQLQAFQSWLDENDLYVFTLNGFPYGQFHGGRVKDQVYAPDWRTDARMAYTQDLIHILTRLLPADVKGSISTLPASYKPWFLHDCDLTAPRERSADNLASIALLLWETEQTTGKLIRIGLEPEPDGLVEDTDEFITYFERFLVPAVVRKAHQQNMQANRAEEIVRRYIGICFDTCHSSVQYEQPSAALSKLSSSGIAVTKLQISSAVKARWESQSEKQHVLASLRELGDPVYLHQVRERRADGSLFHFTDLPAALELGARTNNAEWRVHFHVPVFLSNYGSLSSTNEDTAACIDLCLKNGWCDHLEIETYTWDVLPPDLKTALVPSITQEFNWTRNQISL